MISEILTKYLSNEATEQEIKTLFEWIDASEENNKEFITAKKIWAMTSLSDLNSISETTVIQLKPRNKVFKYLKFAALFLVLFGLGKLAFNYNHETKNSKEIVLELADGRSEFITKNNETKIVNDKGDLIAKKFTNQITYFGKVQNQEVVYNTLKVPYGKRFKLQLSDGTVVRLNSGTTLKYPEQFGLNAKRNVYLTGEAFFEVAKDKTHPFIVHANHIEVEVLGTKFNVSAYPENPTVNSTLIEGSIKLAEAENKSNTVLIVPNQMATWQNNSKKITTKFVDTSIYSAWTKGDIAFKDTPFSTIAKIIERTYDVKIINGNSDLARQSFTGSIKISESSVENILELLKRDTPFNYAVKENTITITNIP